LSLEAALASLRAGEPEKAHRLIESLLASRPDDARLWHLAGACQLELHRPEHAIEAFERALALAPGNFATLYASALALEDVGRADAALERYAQVLALHPSHADAHHNRGLLLAKLGRTVEALQSHAAYATTLPGDARAHADLADAQLAMEQYEEALASARRAIEINPRAMLAALIAGLACAMLEKHAEAESWLDVAQGIDPAGFDRFVQQRMVEGNLDRDLDPRAIYLIRGFDRLRRCDWRGYRHYISRFADLIERGHQSAHPLASPPLVFRSLSIPLSLEQRKHLADGVSQRLSRGARAWRTAPRSRRKVRVGYVSPDFGTHPTGILSAPIFALHDRERFEVHAFSLSPDDGSDVRRIVRRDADAFHDLHGASFRDTQEAVRGADVDILVDLAGATTGAVPELFAHRAARHQVSYLGFPGTSGRGIADFLVCDGVCVPQGDESGYAEQIIRLPTTFWVCEPGPLPQPTEPRSAFGLPECAFVLYAHHPGQKITPEVYSVWMEILMSAPNAILWLLEDTPGMSDNLRRQTYLHGVDPTRLVFAPRIPYARYRNRLVHADLALDTPIYNGGATTLDALACGVPVLTCLGQGFAGRMAASAVLAAGLDDLVVATRRDYAATAIELARQRDTQATLRRRALAARESAPLFDVRARVRELESAYLTMLAKSAELGGTAR
jgi:protein O-GlcNAc transferase